jgi:L-asparaginase / beta-aspartyl-peptidase
MNELYYICTSNHFHQSNLSFNMKNLLLLSICFLMVHCKTEPTKPTSVAETVKPAEYAIAIHGGVGTITRQSMTPKMDTAYRKALEEALTIGENILKNGGTSLDAVEQTIIFLENNPLFNAGKGAVYTHEGKHELDASIMNGSDLKAGAVGGVTIVKNPIKAARAVMERSKHVMLAGRGADQFAKEMGLEIVDNKWFDTPERYESWQKIMEEEQKTQKQEFAPGVGQKKFGTVGVACLDKSGNLAAGTSTGGMTNKRWNRLGDSPVIGAGTYADNSACAISCTGHGEFFIRFGVAKDICDLVAYKGMKLKDATEYEMNDRLKKVGGEGGVIAVDRLGNIALSFNSEGMYRGYAKPGERKVMIYGGE